MDSPLPDEPESPLAAEGSPRVSIAVDKAEEKRRQLKT